MMKLSSVVVVLSAVVLIGAVGCKSAKQEAAAPAPQVQPVGDMGQAGNALSGKVVETMNSGGYTYVSLENNGKKIWVAMPETKVKVGQNVTCQAGLPMQNFTSKTLKRTFESIIFSGGIM
jgi:hypothetical protein